MRIRSAILRNHLNPELSRFKPFQLRMYIHMYAAISRQPAFTSAEFSQGGRHDLEPNIFPSDPAAQSIDGAIKDLLDNLQEIKVRLWRDKRVNNSAILEVITKHQDLVSTELLRESNKKLCLDTFEEYSAIMFYIVTEDPEFVKDYSVAFRPPDLSLSLAS
ncbi:hypothetical protein AWC38_SpisGene15964 [Stylophora pistillata]|uniref:Uncharacterized protein n=1 Tax=Stylophora pistillata TaxID=50429 RepID=A0A2B4RTI5_STYPI|nr:hypothetical protein AWC38_SpisGene15964 [Stylophora pistillata]